MLQSARAEDSGYHKDVLLYLNIRGLMAVSVRSGPIGSIQLSFAVWCCSFAIFSFIECLHLMLLFCLI
jgi:hypothetical protein